MAIVKIQFNKDAETTLAYAFNEKEFCDPVDSENCSPTKEASIEEFAAIRNLHNVKSGNQAVHIIQSWTEKESSTLTLDQINRMGREMAEKHFPGHQFVVVTHSNTSKRHNHIVVNTVNMETGRKIQNKKELLYKLRETNDQIAIKNGLGVINKEQRDRSAKMPEKVKRMERFKGESYVRDAMQKADVARAYATSYDQYSAILGGLGVAVRVEKKNITYLYPGQTRGKRGDRLGPEYSKQGLEEAFRANDIKQAAHPELRAQVRGMILSAAAGAKTPSQGKDYSAFTPVPRGQEWSQKHSQATLASSYLPIEEIHRAKSASIPEYCGKHGIELTTNEHGQSMLKHRPQVVVAESIWKNTKNSTQGSLIDIVAAHQNLTYIQAIAHINGNPNLLLLENTFGAQKRKIQCFYVPKPKTMDFPKAVERTAGFLKAMGGDPRTAQALVGSGRATVKGNGNIVLSSAGQDKGSVEYFEEPQGTWTKGKKRNPQTPFQSASGSGSRLLIFGSPPAYLKQTGREAFTDRKRRDAVLALFEPSTQAIDDFLGKNPHVKTLEFVPHNPKKVTQGELDFFGILKTRYQDHGLQVELSGPDHERSRGGHELSF